jgi:hypothetical protein
VNRTVTRMIVAIALIAMIGGLVIAFVLPR